MLAFAPDAWRAFVRAEERLENFGKAKSYKSQSPTFAIARNSESSLPAGVMVRLALSRSAMISARGLTLRELLSA